MPKQGIKIHICVQKINQPNFKYLNQNHKEEDFIAIGFFLFIVGLPGKVQIGKLSQRD